MFRVGTYPKSCLKLVCRFLFPPTPFQKRFISSLISCQARKCSGLMGRHIDAAFQQPLPRWWCSASGCTSSSRRRTSLSGSRPGYCLAPALGQLGANRGPPDQILLLDELHRGCRWSTLEQERNMKWVGFFFNLAGGAFLGGLTNQNFSTAAPSWAADHPPGSAEVKLGPSQLH